MLNLQNCKFAFCFSFPPTSKLGCSDFPTNGLVLLGPMLTRLLFELALELVTTKSWALKTKLNDSNNITGTQEHDTSKQANMVRLALAKLSHGHGVSYRNQVVDFDWGPPPWLPGEAFELSLRGNYRVLMEECAPKK